jgi:hypothetical protein
LSLSPCTPSPRRPRRSLKPRRRRHPPLRRNPTATDTPTRFACSHVSRGYPQCPPPCPETLDWGPAGELRRPAPPQPLATCFAPPPAARTHLAPSDQDPTHLVQPAAPLNPHASTATGSRSNGSRSSRPGSIPVNPACSRNFARKPLSFLVFTKIPFHHRGFFTV